MRDEANEECSGCEERWCWGEEVMVMMAKWHGLGEKGKGWVRNALCWKFRQML